MAEMKFTDQQQDAIAARGGVLVSAAAGSGKTAVLVERVVRRMLDKDEKIPADRFLISTFTNDAAAEMKERIAARLDEYIASSPNDSWYARQRFLLERAKIGTMDSFCIGLVREYFYLVDLEPDFRLCDNAREKDMKKAALSAAVGERLASGDEEFLKLCTVFGTENAADTLIRVVGEVYDYLVTLPFYERYLDDYERMYSDFDPDDSIWIKTLFSSFGERFSSLCRELRLYEAAFSASDIADKYHDRVYGRFHAIEKAARAMNAGDYDGCRAALLSYEKKTLSRVKTDDVSFLQQIQALCRRADSAAEQALEIFKTPMEEHIKDIQALSPLVKTLCDTVRDYARRLGEMKRQAGLYGFADIEMLALKLLARPDGEATDIAKELSQFYCEVTVDEFQDTNDLQCAIYNALSDGGKKLFAVGDVKQSIYGFRKANPRIFLDKKNSLPLYDRSGAQNGCKVVMSGNFRSEQNICGFVNFLFGNIMSARAGQMKYTDEDRLNASYALDFGGKANVRLELVDSSSKTAACEGAALRRTVQIIHELTAGEYRSKSGERRRMRYSDIAVIYRTKRECSALCEALEAAGIPFVSRSGSGFFDAREIKCAYALLSVIDNPKNDFEMLSLLSGELYGFSAEEIAEIKIRDKQSDLYAAMLKLSDSSEKISRFIADLHRYRLHAARLGLRDLILRVFDDSGLMNLSAALGKRRAEANLYRLSELAAEYDREQGLGLSGFLRYFRRIREQGAVDSKSADEAGDAVRVMNVHNSKGLQFPVCILGGLERRYGEGAPNDLRAVQSEKCGIGLKIVDTANFRKYKTLPFYAAESENAVAEFSEEIRLLYVAMTRAEQQLILIGECGTRGGAAEYIAGRQAALIGGGISENAAASAKSSLDLITTAALIHPCGESLAASACGKKGEPAVYEGVSANVVFADDIPPIFDAAPLPKREFDEERVAAVAERLTYTYPYEIVNTVAAKQSASKIAHSEENADYSCSAVPLFLQGQKLTPAQKGTAMHKLMQYLDLAAAKTDVAAALGQVCDKNVLSAAELESINREQVAAFAASPLAERMIKAAAEGKIYREREFMAELPARRLMPSLPHDFDGETVVVQGAVDCVFFEQGKMVIVDYKTDRACDEKALSDKYSAQLKTYEAALGQVFGCDESELIIWSFELNRQIIL